MAGLGWTMCRLRKPLKVLDEIHGGPSLFSAPGPLGADVRFMQSARFEQLCKEDASLQAAIKKAARVGYNAPSLQRIEAAMRRVFEEIYIPEVLEYYYAIEPVLAQFLAAREAYFDANPAERKEYEQ